MRLKPIDEMTRSEIIAELNERFPLGGTHEKTNLYNLRCALWVWRDYQDRNPHHAR